MSAPLHSLCAQRCGDWRQGTGHAALVVPHTDLKRSSSEDHLRNGYNEIASRSSEDMHSLILKPKACI